MLLFETAMTNVSGATLDIGSPTTKGRENAGYGGLFWRGPRAFTGGTILWPGHAGGEEARGTRAEWMGFTGRQRLLRIELPLALPLIVAGVRLASVSTIGLVTVTAVLGDGFGGLGFFILEGYRRSFPTELYAGAVLSILLALAVDVALARVQRRLTPWRAAAAAGAG